MTTLPFTVPNVFANSTSNIALSLLDADFISVTDAINGIGNGSTALTSVNITGGSVSNVSFSGGGGTGDIGRNLLHNSMFNIQQRGAGGFTGSGIYTADRWQSLWSGGSQTINIVPSTDTIRTQIGDESANWQFVNAFTGGAGTSDFSVITQPIEGVRRLAGKTATVSFYAATGSGNINIGVGFAQVFGTGGSPSANTPVAGQKVVASPTWQRFSLTFALPSIAGKTLGTNGNDFTGLQFWFSSGTANANNAGSIGVQSGGIGMWGVQLEIGSVATPLEKPDPRYDLANCQRFYQQWNTYLVVATATTAGQPLYALHALPVTMRAYPTVTTSDLTYVNSVAFTTLDANPSHPSFYLTSVAPSTSYVAGTLMLSADL